MSQIILDDVVFWFLYCIITPPILDFLGRSATNTDQHILCRTFCLTALVDRLCNQTYLWHELKYAVTIYLQ